MAIFQFRCYIFLYKKLNYDIAFIKCILLNVSILLCVKVYFMDRFWLAIHKLFTSGYIKFLCRFFSYFSFEITDNNMVNVYPIGDSIYAATEMNYLIKVDAETLDRSDKVTLLIIVAHY